MKERIKAIIAARLGIDAAGIDDYALLAEELGADSLDLVEIIIAVEDSLGVEISDEEVMEMKCVTDMVAYSER
ncbi:MAG: acyl carrier protein [Clostridia bacterium]|nr:acyl carrier protein [Clostridia bacterium]